jgi:hypothetical protein
MAQGIIIKTSVQGVHKWQGVVHQSDLKNVDFLQYPHFHIFEIKCKKYVNHSDRDVEIINLKLQIDKYIRDQYFNTDLGYCVFQEMSCEMLAIQLADHFNLDYCEVIEDGNFGGFCEAG